MVLPEISVRGCVRRATVHPGDQSVRTTLRQRDGSATSVASVHLPRAEIARRLQASGLHELRLVDPVGEHTGGEPSCVDTIIRSLGQHAVRDSFPWRIPPLLDTELLVTMQAVCLKLPADVLEPFAMLAAAQHLPPALRRDALTRVQNDSRWPPNAFEELVSASILSNDDLRVLRLAPHWVEFHERAARFAARLRLLGEATATGDDRTRLFALAASKDAFLDAELGREIAEVARRRHGLLDFIRAARDFELAASLAAAVERGALLVEMAVSLAQAQLLRAVIVALDEAEPLLVDPVLRAQALFQRGKAHVLIEDPIGGTAMQVRAAEAFARTDAVRAAGAFLNASSSLLMTAESNRAQALLRRARDVVGSDPHLGIACDVLEGRIFLAQGEVEKAEVLLSGADSLARHVLSDLSMDHLPTVVEHLLWTYLGSLGARDLYDELGVASETVMSLAQRFGRNEMMVFARGAMAQAAWEQGDYSGAQRWLVGTEDAEHGGATSWITLLRLQILGATGGDVQGAIDRTSIDDFEGPTMWTSLRALSLALEAFGRGEHSTVRDLLEPVLASLVNGGCRSFGGRAWMSLLVESQELTGAHRLAKDTAQRQREWGLVSGFSSLVIPALRSAAVVSSVDDSALLWAEALSAHEKWGHPIELAHTLRARAEHVLRSPEPRRATIVECRDDLDRALHLFTQAGALGFAGRAAARIPEVDALLAALGSTSEVELTGREAEIVALLRKGATNKEIASTLGVSVKTVEAHLRNLFRRNGLRNRAELVGRLHR